MTHTAESRPTAAVINLDNLAFNFRSVRDFVGPNVAYMAVIKANAYGHGAVECARRLETEAVDWFAVALLEEAVELREAGIVKPILCFGGVWPGQEQYFIQRKLTPVIFQPDNLDSLAHAAAAAGITLDVHVKIDTGMGRVGIPCRQAGDFARKLAGFPGIRVQGLMTHFAMADDLNEPSFTNRQIEDFHSAVEAFRSNGHSPKWIDMANSPGAVAHPASHADMVRIGGLLFGLGGDVLPKGIDTPELKPVMSLQTRLAQVKAVPAGESIGYGRTFTTSRDSVIGTIPVGYHDGFRRGLSNKARVIVNGAYAPVVGRVSMDWTIIDLTETPSPRVGNNVFLIGQQNGLAITAEEVASHLETISYEVTCGISARVPRMFYGRE